MGDYQSALKETFRFRPTNNESTGRIIFDHCWPKKDYLRGVAYEGLHCKLDVDGDEDCDYTEEPVERFIGANAIIDALDSTIEAYTYANPPE